MLESADAQASIDDEVPLLADVRLRLDEEVVVPVRQRVPPDDAEGPRSLKVCGLAADQPHETHERPDGGENPEPLHRRRVPDEDEQQLEE